MLYFIKQIDIKNLLIKLVKSWRVFAPIEQTGKDVLLEKLPEDTEKLKKTLKRLALSSKTLNEQTLIPPKEVFFPQSEVMFTYSSDSPDHNEPFNLNSAQDSTPSKPALLFGIKPCDYHALNITESFFKSGFKDYYYLNKSDNYLALVFGCVTPPEPDSCFCSSTGTGPVLTEDSSQKFDIQFIEDITEKDVNLPGGYFVEIGTDRGKEFIETNSDFFKILPDQSAAQARLKHIKTQAFKNIELSVNFKKALSIMDGETVQTGTKTGKLLKNAYQGIADRCIYCGACLYVCPTCTCFNVYDNTATKTSNIQGERVRVWDACVFSGYTREASGHNPRAEAYTRTARRYEHKLKYDPAVYGRSSCVGCGRCLTACPVNIGMSTFIQEITENHEE